MAYKPRTEAQKAARRKGGGRITRLPRYPVCKAPHLTGSSLVEFIRRFDHSRGLLSGNVYKINGERVAI